LNGTLECVGISEPIAVGDNLEFDSVVYHIEQIVHNASINPQNGMKTFRTTLSLSHGVSIESDSSGTVYGQMNTPNAYVDRSTDFVGEQILPGISESQDTAGRTTLDHASTINTPFTQPSTKQNRDGGSGNNG
jgi:hypothetical protein